MIHQFVFSIAWTADRFRCRWVVRSALRQHDGTRFKEIANALVSWFSINVQFVVCRNIEGTEWFPTLVSPFLQILIKDCFPTLCVNAGGVGNHPVHVEENRIIVE